MRYYCSSYFLRWYTFYYESSNFVLGREDKKQIRYQNANMAKSSEVKNIQLHLVGLIDGHDSAKTVKCHCVCEVIHIQLCFLPVFSPGAVPNFAASVHPSLLWSSMVLLCFMAWNHSILKVLWEDMARSLVKCVVNGGEEESHCSFQLVAF